VDRAGRALVFASVADNQPFDTVEPIEHLAGRSGNSDEYFARREVQGQSLRHVPAELVVAVWAA
jgi:hypothetical protein